MYAGRHPGSRTIQGLTIKAQFDKLSAAAEHEADWYIRSAFRHWRIKTVQNLVSGVVVTLASTLAIRLALDNASGVMKWMIAGLAAIATVSNFIIVTRRHSEDEAAHFQIAKRCAALAASCRASVTKYEESQLDDDGFQALLDQQLSDREALKRDTQTSFSVRGFRSRSGSG